MTSFKLMSPIEHFMQSQESKRSEISSDIAISSSALGIRSFKMKKIQVSNHKFIFLKFHLAKKLQDYN